MLCQECQKKTATVHFTQIINNEQYEQHLCEQCAREKGEYNFEAYPPFSIQNLLTGLMNIDTSLTGKVIGFPGKIQCESCGLTYAQFGQLGRFGCSSCYDAFGERLLPLFRRVHGSTKHAGKVPARAGGVFKLRRTVEDLRRQLQLHVAREEFEQAAKLRDEIRGLEGEMISGGGPDEQ